MGTQPIPKSNPKPASSAPGVTDIPRVGLVMWVLLAGFLVPPAAVTLVGAQLGTLPHQTLWVILLCLPAPALLLTLPRRYALDDQTLTVSGLFYRVRIPRADIRRVEPIGVLGALVHPGSLFCSDPARALRVERRSGRSVIISPHERAPFEALTPPEAEP